LLRVQAQGSLVPGHVNRLEEAGNRAARALVDRGSYIADPGDRVRLLWTLARLGVAPAEDPLSVLVYQAATGQRDALRAQLRRIPSGADGNDLAQAAEWLAPALVLEDLDLVRERDWVITGGPLSGVAGADDVDRLLAAIHVPAFRTEALGELLLRPETSAAARVHWEQVQQTPIDVATRGHDETRARLEARARAEEAAWLVRDAGSIWGWRALWPGPVAAYTRWAHTDAEAAAQHLWSEATDDGNWAAWAFCLADSSGLPPIAAEHLEEMLNRLQTSQNAWAGDLLGLAAALGSVALARRVLDRVAAPDLPRLGATGLMGEHLRRAGREEPALELIDLVETRLGEEPAQLIALRAGATTPWISPWEPDLP
jgi:hypothetical protein